MSGLVRPAPAKLNVILEVDPPGPDGYHPVRSLMAVLPGLADTVQVAVAEHRAVECPGVPERENLAWRALDALAEASGQPMDLRVVIEKRIPAQAGLGGGSSDAATTLVAANDLLGLGVSPDDLERVAARVGSDVAFFVRGGVQWAGGRGELLESAAALPPAWAALVRPSFGLSTPAVYRRFDQLRPPERRAIGPIGAPLGAHARNDLWAAALALSPGLARLARALRVAGADGVVLCGSGSTIAGIFSNEGQCRDVVNALGRQHGWWTASSRIG